MKGKLGTFVEGYCYTVYTVSLFLSLPQRDTTFNQSNCAVSKSRVALLLLF